jgi:hypothetical protein
MIDSLKLFETLKSGDLAEAQARAIVQAIGSAFDDNELHQSKGLAAKVDAAKMEAEVQQLETTLREDIFGVRMELKAEIKGVRTDLMAEIAAVRNDMKAEFAAVRNELKTEFAGVRNEMKAEFTAVRAEMKAIAAELRAEMVQLESRLETKIAESKSSMIRWMFIFWIGQVAAMRLLR